MQEEIMQEETKQENVAASSMVKITIEGIAVCDYKKTTRLWNILFPNHDEHDFELLIARHGINPACELINLEPGSEIAIRAHNIELPGLDDPTFQAGDFDPASAKNHPQDWRWFINLDQLHHNEVHPKDGAPRSFLTVDQCIFYTDMVTACSYELYRIGQPAPVRPYGKMGIKAAAKFDLNKTDGRVTLEIKSPSGSGGSYVFEAKEGVWYELAFRNLRSPFHLDTHHAKSDFPLYYDVISTGGERYDFEPELDREDLSEWPVLCGMVSGGKNLF